MRYATVPIARVTIASLTIMQVSDGPWDYYASTIVGYVLWWIGVARVFLMALIVMTILIFTANQSDRFMTTAGAEAGFITIYGYGMIAGLAVPQIIVGYFAIDFAMFMALLLYTM